MAARTRPRAPSHAGDAPPPPPIDVPVDEGPMRRELLRQIALLDAELGALTSGLESTRVTPLRGPAMQPTIALERIRDELLAELDRVGRA
jgi:hypothetical protein